MTAAAFDPPFALDAFELPHRKIIGGRPLPSWGQDVLALPARLLLELPLPPRLGLHVPGIEGIVRVGRGVDRSFEGDICFDEVEWWSLVRATEADRVWPRDFALMCHRKSDGHRLEPVDALAGAQPDPTQEWSLRSVLERLGVELLSVELD